MAGKRKTSWVRRLLRELVVTLLVLVAIPVILTPVYLVVDPVSMPMLVRGLTGQKVERIWRPIDTLSDRLKAALVTSEDGQFCRHWGVDFDALRDEFDVWRAGGTPRGASTITMQVARNLFLWNDRSYLRKLLEIPLALYIDLVMPKRRIMEIYLNIAEWGPDGEFGAEAGAQRAFGIPATSLSWSQASLLAVSITNPHIRFAGNPSARLRRIAGIVQARAVDATRYIACLYADGRGPAL